MPERSEGGIILLNYFELMGPSAARDLELEYGRIDLKLIIMRKPWKGVPAGCQHAPSLAPSAELFAWYRAEDAKLSHNPDGSVRFRGPHDKEAWWPVYRERFLEGLRETEIRLEDKAFGAKSSPARAIEILADCVRQGYVVAIACSCHDERYCHRSLVKDVVMASVEGR